MDDYSALAQRIALSIREVRGCLILSRDGLVLAAYPDEEEAAAKAAWLRFCVLGEPEKSFVEFPDQTWAFVRRGPYAAFAMADAGVRPGVMVDQLEQLLLTAESERSKRDSMRLPDAQGAPSGKPRTNLHPGGVRQEPGEDRGKWSRNMPEIAGAKSAASGSTSSAPLPVQAPVPAPIPDPTLVPVATSSFDAVGQVQPEPEPRPMPQPEPPPAPPPQTPAPATAVDKPVPAIAAAAAAVAAAKKEAEARAREQQTAETTPATPVTPDGVATALRKTPQKLIAPESESSEEEGEVDPVMLAREFSRLLQMNSDDDEGSS
jgi:hypothetical protein